ncbi:uncharacterized protein LOC110108149 [Dendrobium catenatum]|uniref:uncharacterized protein LOC110108149 n=1 Tax=Dendrobium catenatum TaxID=906689 RepID=UPI0009F28A2E|nr:uncharacterized protein LOC110108149 [Dendrobium catenatum]
MVSAVDKGKRPVVSQPSAPPPQQPPQKQPFQIIPQHTRDHAIIPFRERLETPYPFKRDSVKRIFKSLLKKPDFQLPEDKRPVDESKKEDPKYCPYHRILSHPLEDYVVFKDWLERTYIQVFAAQKLRHYMLFLSISLISKVNPLEYLMTRPTLSGRLARWSMILLQFEITFIPLRAVKGQAVADFLEAHPLPADSPLNDDLPDEQVMSLRKSGEAIWELYFDGVVSFRRDATQQSIIPRKVRVGLIFIMPERGMMHFFYHLLEPCKNNEAEYEAMIIDLKLAILMEIKAIKIFGDSQLVINQVAGTYKVLNPNLSKYHKYTLHLLEQILTMILYRVPRGSNSSVDALAKLAKEFTCQE